MAVSVIASAPLFATSAAVASPTPKTPTITFFSSAPVGAAYSGSNNQDYPVAATSSDGSTIAYSIDSSSTSGCAISGSSVFYGAGVGTCVIDANDATAPQTQQSFTVGRAPQTISFSSNVPSNPTYSGSSSERYTVVAKASSGLAVTYTIDSSSTSGCAISGSSVSYGAAVGTCVIDANQSGDSDYLAASQAQQSFTVGQALQTVSFSSTPPSDALVGATYQAVATSSSGLTVNISVDSTSSSICSISGTGLVKFSAAGSCVIDANQPGDATFASAPQVQQTVAVVTVGATAQSITFTSTAPSSASIAGAYIPSATATSGLAVVLSIDSASTTVCALSAGVVTFDAKGNCVIDANQAGNATFAPAAQVQQIVTVVTSATSNTVSLVPDGGSGSLDLAKLSFSTAVSDLQAGAAILDVPLRLSDAGITLPSLTVTNVVTLSSTTSDSISIEGDATLPFGSVPILLSAVWGGASTPSITLGVHLANISLGTIDPAWTGVGGTTFADAEAIFSATATSLDPATLPATSGASDPRAFYDPALCRSGATTIALAAGVSFCGTLSAAGDLATALGQLGLSASATITGSLGGPAVIFGHSSLSQLDGVNLTGTFAASSSGPIWLNSSSLTANLTVSGLKASLTLNGSESLVVGSVTDTFSGSIGIATNGVVTASLAGQGTSILPFGLSNLSNPTNVDLELTLDISKSPSLQGVLAFSYMPTGTTTAVEVEATLSVTGSTTVTATLAIGSKGTGATLGPLPGGVLVALGSDVLGISAPTIPNADSVSLDSVSLTIAQAPSASGSGSARIVTFGGNATMGTLGASFLLSIHDDNGTITPLFGLQIGQPGCTTNCGTSLASLFPGATIGGMLSSINLPTVDVFAAGAAISLPASSLTTEESNFFTAVDGTLPATVTVPSGLTLTAKVPTDIFGTDLAQLFGYDGNQTVVLSGTLGGSLNLSNLGSPGVNLTGLSLSAILPATTAPPELLSGLVQSVGETTFNVAYTNGTLSASIDASATLSIAGSTIDTTLSASGSISNSGSSVSIDAAVPDWTHPFGISWIDSASAKVVLNATYSGGAPTFNASVSAGVALQTSGPDLHFTISADLNVADTTSLTVTVASTDSATLGQLVSLFPEVTGLGTDVSNNPVLSAIAVGPINLTVVISSHPSLEIGAQASVTLPGSSTPVTGHLLVEVSGASFTLGVEIANLSLADVLPPNTLAGADQLVLPTSALVLTDAPTPIAASSLTPDEYNFYKVLYGCPADATLSSCTDFTSVTIGTGLTFISSMDMPTIVAEEAAKIGIALPAPGTGAVFTVMGTLPLFGGGASLSLTASITNIVIPGAPNWFPSGHVSLSITTAGIDIVGGVTLTIPRVLAPPGATCDNGGVNVAWGSTTYCSDRLDFRGDLSIEFPTDGDPAIALSGIFQDLNGVGAADTTYWYPFGLPGVGVHRLALSLSVQMAADGPTIGLGIQGDITVGNVDMAGAINIGLTPIPDPPFVIPDLLGISGSSASGLSLGDFVSLSNSLVGANITPANVDALPNISLRNLNFSFSQVNDPALCLVTGLHFSADLYDATTPVTSTSPVVPSYSDPNGCRKVNTPAGPSSDCIANQAQGCLTSVFGSADESGLVAQGETNAFNLGLISFQQSTLDLTLTAADQHLTLIGGASVTASNGYNIANGFANLKFGLQGLQFLSNASLLNNTIHGTIEADAPVDFTNPNFSFKVWLSSDISAAINGALANALTQIKPLVLDVNNIVQSMNGNGGIPQFSTFNQLVNDTAQVTKIPVSPIVTSIINTASSIQQALQAAGLGLNLDWILNGVQITPPIYVPAVTLIPAFNGTSGKYVSPGCYDIFGNPSYYLGSWCLGDVVVQSPGKCFYFEINGNCYGLPPTPALVIPAYTIPAIKIPGLCADLSLPSSECSWSGLLSDLVLTPILNVVDQATGLSLSAGSPGQSIDQLISYFTQPQPTLFSLNCAQFSASGSDLASLGQGSVNVSMAINATVLGQTFSGGLAWNLGNVSDAGSLIPQLFKQLFNPQPTSCTPPPGATLLSAPLNPPPAPPETITGALSSTNVNLGQPVTFSGAFATTASSYPAVSVDWGDGTVVTIPAGTSATISATHTYVVPPPAGTSALNAVVSVKVEDSGADTLALPITVSQSPPKLTSLALATPNVVEGSTAQLTGTYVNPSQADTDTVAVNWGDGSAVESISLSPGSTSFAVSHRYLDDPASSGDFPISVTLSDQHAGSSTMTTQETVSEAVPNSIALTPVSVISGPAATSPNGVTESALVNYQLNFNDAAPMDAHRASIDWGDGSTPTQLTIPAGTTSALVAHQFLDEGNYAASATVSDEELTSSVGSAGQSVVSTSPDGASAQGVSAVHVLDAPLVASAPVTIVPIEGLSFTGAVGIFNDMNPGATASDFSASINWGDGTTSVGTVAGPTGGPFAVSGSHTYADEAHLPVAVTVNDVGGSAVTIGDSATVEDASLSSLAPVSLSATEGQAYSGTVGAFTDANPTATTSDFTATINWGDGTTSNGTVSGPVGGPFVVGGTHTYLDEGNYRISTSVTDVGGSTVAIAASAVAGDAALTAGTMTLTTATEGLAPTQASFAFADANPNATVSDFAATINWGDGTTTSGTVSASGAGFVVTGEHAYLDEGTYRPMVSVTDDGGSTTGAISTAAVMDAALTAGTMTLTTATEGLAPTQASFAFTDANPNATAADFSSLITWGDGSASLGSVSKVPGGFIVTGQHSYADERTYHANVFVADDGGSTTGVDASAVVTDAPLSATSAEPDLHLTSFGGPVANLVDANPTATTADFVATINWGDGTTSSGTVSGAAGNFVVSGTHNYLTTGYMPIKTVIVDDGGSTTATSKTVLIYARLASGSMVVGANVATTGTPVTFWGARWAKVNSLGGVAAPSSFKGFESSNATAVCGDSWNTTPGDSPKPPSGPLPAYMSVIASGSLGQSGSSIAGAVQHMVVVHTSGGYAPDPGHAGTGTVVASIC